MLPASSVVVCNKKLVGEDAANAYHRVLEEANNNVWKMSLGFPPTREVSPFVGKLFPHLPRQTEDDIRERIASTVEQKDSREWLTRKDFPLGTAAYLYLQARLFVAAGSDMYASTDEAVVRLRKAKTRDDPRHPEHDLNRRLGSTMARGMVSSFACELVMKAVSLYGGRRGAEDSRSPLPIRSPPGIQQAATGVRFPGYSESHAKGATHIW